MMLSADQWNRLWFDILDKRNELEIQCSDLPFWADSEPCRGLVAQVDQSVLDREPQWRSQAASSPDGAAAVLRLLQNTRATLDNAARDIGMSLTWSAAWRDIAVQTGRDAASGVVSAALPAGLGVGLAAAAYFLLRR